MFRALRLRPSPERRRQSSFFNVCNGWAAERGQTGMMNAGAPGTAPRRRAIAVGRTVSGVALLLALGQSARAASPAEPASANDPVSDATARMQVSDRPWAVGVTPERQEAALKHLQEGNSLLKESLFVEAAKAYRQALAEWDHPGIHYNLALALLNMDQPVEVYQNLESAIKYGADPLDPEKLEHAKSYLRLIEKQVATVDIRCDVDGAQVTFDGAALFRAPGRYQGLVRAGTHTVTASKPGFTTTSLTEDLTSDKRTALQLKLYTSGELIGYRRRYPLWRPVAVAGFGGALLLAGVAMSLQAQKYFNAYDDSVGARCLNPPTDPGRPGCGTSNPDYPALSDLKRRGNLYRTLATTSLVAGGSIAAAGLVLLLLDRPTPYRVDPEGEPRDLASARSYLVPVLGAGMAGLAGGGSF
jgi:tetratricopeptide (TPR) repeat protein